MPELGELRTGNGRVDSTGAEQQNRLPEQRRANLGHRERPTGGFDQLHHAEDRATSFASFDQRR